MQVTLVMFKADGTRRDFPLRKDRIIIGRANTADLRIPLSSVSRQHCEVRVEQGLVKLQDLGSSNGTYQNSTRIQETILSPGDEVIVGPVVFTLVVDGLPKVVEPVRTVIPESSPHAAGSASSVKEAAAQEAQLEEAPMLQAEPEAEAVLEPDSTEHLASQPAEDMEADELPPLVAEADEEFDAIPLADDDDDADAKHKAK